MNKNKVVHPSDGLADDNNNNTEAMELNTNRLTSTIVFILMLK